MLSFGRLSSASEAAGYYIKGGEGQIAGYYADHVQASKWGGGAKDLFGLPDGRVDLKRFEALLDGQVSDTQTLGRNVKGVRLRDLGRDFTFSASKSVSLAATGELKEPILKAFAISVDRTMAYYEKNLAQVRVWDNEKERQVKTGDQKILYAKFVDMLSRGNDPQLHIHVPVVNLAVDKNGKIRSLNFDLAYKHKILLGNIQRAEFAKELRGLGFQIKPAGKNGLWELEGSAQDLLDQFSKRRQQIIRQAPHKVGDAAALAKIARTSRPAKEKAGKAALEERWSQEFAKHGHSFKSYTKALQSVPQRDNSELNPKAAINFAISHMSETEAHFDKYTLLKHAMVSVYGHVDIKTMEAELDRRIEKGQLLVSEDGRWLKPEKTHRLEKQLGVELKKGHLNGRVLSSQGFENYKAQLETLTDGQRAAAELILTDKHRFNGVDGIAGSGKTYLLEKTLPALKAKGYDLIGLAPSDKALEGLTKSGVFDQTLTTQKFHLSPRGNSNTILVVDETGMVGNEHVHALMHFANSKNMPKVVFLGDKDQLPPVDAGRPFAHLQDMGLRTVRMEDIVRQKNSRHAKGVKQLSLGQILEGFQTFDKEIHEVIDEPLESYTLKLRQKLDDPSIIVNTNAECKTINDAIKAENMSHANVRDGLKRKIWNPVHMSKTERMRAGSYEGASHIRFLRDVGKDFNRNEMYKIDKVDHSRAELILTRDGETKFYRPARHGSGDSFTQAYKQSEITLNVGDQIKFRKSDKKLGISNNDFGQITNIKDGAVTISLEDDKQITLPAKHRMLGHIDHAWANTAYSFQGATVKDNIVIMRADRNPLNTLASLYVGSSRHKDNLAIVTDDKERLMQIISEKLEVNSEVIKFREFVSDKSSGTKVERDNNNKVEKETRIEPKEQHLEMGGFRF